MGSGVKVGSLLREAPFGLHARFGERVDGRVWFHLVALAAMTNTGEPVIVGGKGPGRGNYGLVRAGSYRNYAGLVTGHAADDDFTDLAVRATIGALAATALAGQWTGRSSSGSIPGKSPSGSSTSPGTP